MSASQQQQAPAKQKNLQKNLPKKSSKQLTTPHKTKPNSPPKKTKKNTKLQSPQPALKRYGVGVWRLYSVNSFYRFVLLCPFTLLQLLI
jgi:hypothetical protein